MRNHQLAIGVMGVLVAIVVGIGLTIIGNPISQQTVRYDETRYNDFQQIRYRVETYYTNNRRLPASLSELNYVDLNTTDPVSKKTYEYKTVDEDTYQLCTEFSTSAEEFKRSATNTYWDIPISHKKGYSCISFTLPAYTTNPVR